MTSTLWQCSSWHVWQFWMECCRLSGLACLLVGTLIAHAQAEVKVTASPAFLQNGVTAHRGNSGEFPENTLPAFESGIELGADWLELDFFRTADGELVVIHDATTGRVAEHDLPVATSTVAQLLELDVATDFRKRTGRTLAEVPPQRMPLLRDVLQLVMKQQRTRVSLQPKMDCVAEAVALVRELRAERWVGFNDGNLQWMSQVKELAPEIPVFWDRGPQTDLAADLKTARQRGFESLVYHHSRIKPELIQAVQSAGLEVGAWTVNDPAQFKKFVEWGIDRIYTDHPRQLLALHFQDRYRAVTCEGVYPHHLQGVCVDQSAIYWCFTTVLVKTDLDGKLLKQVPVANHHGDLCHHAGRIYVAVNLGKFNDPQGNADSWVYVYDADTLEEVARQATPEVFHGAGGIGATAGRFYVVGGLPQDVQENYVYEYDAAFNFVQKHVIASGWTQLGIQTATFAHNRWWFGCYGSPAVLLITDPQFQLLGRYEYNCSLGIEALPAGSFLSAGGRCQKDIGCTGWVKLAAPDEKTGLKLVNSAK